MSRLHLSNWDKSIGKKSHHHVTTPFLGRDIERRQLWYQQKIDVATKM